MRIAVDAMGGDFAPGEIVKGAVLASRDYGLEVVLTGDECCLEAELKKLGAAGEITVVHAPEVISMKEQPAVAVKRKKNSSIVTAARLVKEGYAKAFVSAGNTGAAMASALLELGRIKGIDRPAIAVMLPNEKGVTVLIDAGANVDAKPRNLFQFGIMGYLYAQKILGMAEPRVGLLSNGEEETKGNEVTTAAYPLLTDSGVNFIGNVEGRDIFSGAVDVVVCDGFVGNIVLKAGEGLASSMMKMMKEEITKSWLAKMGTVMAEPALKVFQKRVDYSEYGGAPLLGVNGICIICHGRSKAKAVKNAVRVACEMVQNKLVEAIGESIDGIVGKGVGTRIAQ